MFVIWDVRGIEMKIILLGFILLITSISSVAACKKLALVELLYMDKQELINLHCAYYRSETIFLRYGKQHPTLTIAMRALKCQKQKKRIARVLKKEHGVLLGDDCRQLNAKPKVNKLPNPIEPKPDTSYQPPRKRTYINSSCRCKKSRKDICNMLQRKDFQQYSQHKQDCSCADYANVICY